MNTTINTTFSIVLPGQRLVDSFVPATNNDAWMKRLIIKRRERAKYSVVSDAVKRAFSKIDWGAA